MDQSNIKEWEDGTTSPSKLGKGSHPRPTGERKHDLRQEISDHHQTTATGNRIPRAFHRCSLSTNVLMCHRVVDKVCVGHLCRIPDFNTHSFGTFLLSREHDLFIMPLLAKFIQDLATLAILNECRMFLKAVTLADICTMDGRPISLLAFTGLGRSQALHHFNWPRQPPALPQTRWNLWQEKLLELFIQVRSKDYLLNKPLGQWLIDATKHWTWFLDPIEGHIYELTQNLEYEVYIPSVPHRSGARGTVCDHHHTNAE
jgi:hypothetical protein